MCIVSMMSDHFYPTVPNITPLGPSNIPVTPQITIAGLDPVSVLLLNEAIKRLDELDKRMGLRDCMDEKKEKFLKELSDRVEAIEKESKKKRKKRS